MNLNEIIMIAVLVLLLTQKHTTGFSDSFSNEIRAEGKLRNFFSQIFSDII